MTAQTGSAMPAHCVVDFCVIPIGTASPSTSSYIVRIEQLLRQSGLSFTVNDSSTSIRGQWVEVMNIIGQAHSLIHDAGVQKVHTDVRIETRDWA
ncbi:hypothetical protein WHR41_09428 [Cladosporium halotolerans]|uniref:Thiamine-binding protein domain-containing protein n=1 Tax=Cladosporium halotolerans TaxID=1052096 RepID=A0AB34KFU7_9PEZI